MKWKFLLCGWLLAFTLCTYAVNVRQKQNFDFDWKFRLADDSAFSKSDYEDAAWEEVQLPHDWSIRFHFDFNMGGSAAYLPGGTGWYRKTFTLPKTARGQQISILFDGVFHQSDVYINGHHLGFHPYGFSSFEYDLTPYLSFQEENTLAVRVNHTGDVARWYTGSGIYRHVWLQFLAPIHVATYGTYVTTPVVTDQSAEVHAVTTLKNTLATQQEVRVEQRILNASGKVVAKSATEKITLPANACKDLQQSILLPSPELWNTEHPTMYSLETTVRKGGQVTDQYTTAFGVRTIRFDSQKGFFLNDRPVKLKGMCLHQDAGCLGTAVPDRSYERRLEILKDYGCNAIRCAHNAPSPEFLDMCDRMGFLVIDEAFDKWKSGYYEKYFDEWWQYDLSDMILRDRNHPSIILWSIGNEVQEAWNQDNVGIERAAMLQEFVHQLEPSRKVTLAAQNNHNGKFSAVVDVTGYNYLEARMLTDHKNNPGQCFYVSEELPYYCGAEGNIRSYYTTNPWNYVAENDFIAGGFIWSGVDYLGEAGWPSKGWPNGLIDICMTEKPRAAYHKAMWNEKPVLQITVPDLSLDIDHGRDLWQWPKMVSHWNMPASYQGLVIEVQTITNCEKVQLELNGKVMGLYRTADFENNTIIWHLPYAPGTILAKGYMGDSVVIEHCLTTSKAASKAVLLPDRTLIKADGQDLSHIYIDLYDENGIHVWTDNRLVTVSLEGAGRLLGIDNGELRRTQPFAGPNTLSTYFGRALAIVQSTRQAGNMRLKVVVEGLSDPYYVNIESK